MIVPVFMKIREKIIYFAGTGNYELLEQALEYGGNPNKRGHFNMTPLMAASTKGEIECVKLLLRWGADPNLKAKCGETALMLSIKREHYEISAILQPLTDVSAEYYIDYEEEEEED